MKFFYLISSTLLILNLVCFLLIYLPPINPLKTSTSTSQSDKNQLGNRVDDSCQKDDDCQIKNVGNQCGYYPICVNKKFQPNPPELDSMICGFPSINQCRCLENKCQGF